MGGAVFPPCIYLGPNYAGSNEDNYNTKKQRHYFANKCPSSQGYGFSSSHVWMWELNYKETWAPKNWCFWTVVLEKTLESPLDCKEIQPVHPKGDQSWVFIGRTDVEAKTPTLWPPDEKSWRIWKDPDAWKGWGEEEKGTTEDEMAGWHHWLNGHGFGWTPGVGDGQGGLVCCSTWGLKESDTTEGLNWTEYVCVLFLYLQDTLQILFSYFASYLHVKKEWCFRIVNNNLKEAKVIKVTEWICSK